jgi:antirestriction protein ArdC
VPAEKYTSKDSYMTSQTQLRAAITQQIVTALEGGDLPPWRRTWRADHNCGSPCNVVSRQSYSGLNPLLLSIAGEKYGFESRYWGTFDQWKNIGGQVRARPADVAPGQWGTKIIFCRPVTKTTVKEGGEEVDSKFFVLRTYTVFCLDQVDGPFDRLRPGNAPITTAEVHTRHTEAERVIAATKADIRHGGDKAFYRPSGDYIQVPHRHQFFSPEAYYETVCHELIHWTEHPKRLNWCRAEKENLYSTGELIAELGAVYMMGELGIPAADTWKNSASYLSHWLKAMRADPRFIFRVTSQASRAVDHIFSYSGRQEGDAGPALAA